MAAGLHSLGDNRVHSGAGRSLGSLDRPYLVDHLGAGRVGAIDVGRRVTPEERKDRNPLFQADRHLRLDGKVQDEVDTERLVRQVP
jgi:hypothetical protein